MPLAIKERVLVEALRERADRGNPARAQHDTVAGETQAHVVTRVAQLHADGRIDDDGRDACARFYRDWALGVQGARGERPATEGAADPGTAELRHLIAATRYRQTCQALGPRAAAILTWLVCEERSWEWIAERLRDVEGRRYDEEVARVLAAMCIKLLAEVRLPKPRAGENEPIDTPRT